MNAIGAFASIKEIITRDQYTKHMKHKLAEDSACHLS